MSSTWKLAVVVSLACEWKDKICIIFAGSQMRGGIKGVGGITGRLIGNRELFNLDPKKCYSRHFWTVHPWSRLNSLVESPQTQCTHILFSHCVCHQSGKSEKDIKKSWNTLTVYSPRLIVAQLFASLFGFYRVGVQRRLANINKDAICTSLSLSPRFVV